MQFQSKFLPFSILLSLLLFSAVSAQKVSAVKLPSAERVISDYLKAIGGKKRVALVKDASYEWKHARVNADGTVPIAENAQTRIKFPSASRADVNVGEALSQGMETIATNGTSVWRRDSVGKLETLTDAQANSVRLQAILEATRLTGLEKQRISARTVSLTKVGDEQAYEIEFSMKNGARVRYYFSPASKFVLKIENPALKTSRCFGDYRAANGIMEPHRMTEPCASESSTRLRVYELVKVSQNSGLKLSDFDPPRGEDNFDLQAFLRDLTRNQAEIDRRVYDYSYTEARTEREFNDKGEVKKETIRVYEVFPVPGRRRSVAKLVSENGVELSPERAQKEARRVTEEMEEAERENEKREIEREKAKSKGKEPQEGRSFRIGISEFLRTSELVSPRRELFRGREVIVFDFRPRNDYKPQNNMEKILSRLVGTAWIDPEEKRIMRMEMRFPEGFSAMGGMAKLKSGSAFVFEQTRLEGGVWLPKFTQINAAVKAFFVAGFNFNQTSEFSNYQKFVSEAKDYKIEKPAEQPK